MTKIYMTKIVKLFEAEKEIMKNEKICYKYDFVELIAN